MAKWARIATSPEGLLSLLVMGTILFSSIVLWRLDPGDGPAAARFEAGPGRITAVEVPLRSSWQDWELRVLSTGASLKASLSTPANAASTDVTGPIHPTGLLAPGAFVSFCAVETATRATVEVHRSAGATASASPAFAAELEVPAC